MLDRWQASGALGELLAAFRCLEGLGGAALRARHGLETDEDRNALADWESDELVEERRMAQAQLADLLDDEVRSGLEDLLFRVSAVTGLPPDKEQVQQKLLEDYDLSEVEHVRPLLREVARPLRQSNLPLFRRQGDAVHEFPALWQPYELWNGALAETVFTRDRAGRSVYLDMEPEVIQRAAEAIWPPTADASVDVEHGFRHTVGRTCVTRRPKLNRPFEGGQLWDESIDFSGHADRVDAWHRTRKSETGAVDDPPPCIALLALCSLAAERMRADGEMAANNYYGRLAEVLEVNGDRVNELGIKYRDHALRLWESLNLWLRDLHGQRGLPTAVSFGHHRYVSLPISQALIRAQERDRLSEFFALYQFNPGQQVARDDMERMLGGWVPNSGAVGLSTVWGHGPDMRRRVADLACTELEHWSGDTPSLQSTDSQHRSLLLAATWFEEPEQEFDPFLCVRATDAEGIRGDYRSAEGTAARAQRDADGLISLSVVGGDLQSEGALVAEALDRGFHLEHQSRDASLSFSRRRVIVLLFDPLRQVYLQSRHVELGRQMLLLVDAARSEQVKRALAGATEDAFRIIPPEVHGLSERWALFTNVRLSALPNVEGDELEALIPRSRTQVEFEGGLQLTDGRWHSQAPPSVHVVNGDGRSFGVELLSQSNLDVEPLTLGTQAGQAKIALAGRNLADGDYRIVVTEQGGAQITSRELKLRSAGSAHLDPPRPSGEDLAHALGPAFSARSALSADQSAESEQEFLRGAVIDQRHGLRAVPESRLYREIGEMEPFETIEQLIVRRRGVLDERDLEQMEVYRRLKFFDHSDGHLHLTEAGLRYLDEDAQRARTLGSATPLRAGSSNDLNVDLDLILDALAVIEAGSWNAFRRLIDHSESERFIPHEAIRNLRALAYLDVDVDPRNAMPRRWSLSPPVLVTLPSLPSAILTGRRPPNLIDQLIDTADRFNADVNTSDATGRPTRIQIDAEHPGVLQQVADKVDLPLIFDAPRRILERMPTIQDILRSQPELLVPDGCHFERFDRSRNRWIEVDASEQRLAGGYQIRFPTGERRHAVWTNGVWRECGNATVKYAGAAAVGEHIMAYDKEKQELTCLFGARPPGLFERALILCSGELPATPGDHRSIYRNVSDHVHRWIAAKLGPAGWSR